jgi:hypothetical protein
MWINESDWIFKLQATFKKLQYSSASTESTILEVHNKKKEVEICSQIQSNIFQNNRLNEVKMTSCLLWLPRSRVLGRRCNLICEMLV